MLPRLIARPSYRILRYTTFPNCRTGMLRFTNIIKKISYLENEAPSGEFTLIMDSVMLVPAARQRNQPFHPSVMSSIRYNLFRLFICIFISPAGRSP